MIDINFYVENFEKDYGKERGPEVRCSSDFIVSLDTMLSRISHIFKFMAHKAPIERKEFVNYMERITNSIRIFCITEDLSADANYQLLKSIMRKDYFWLIHPYLCVIAIIDYHMITKRKIKAAKKFIEYWREVYFADIKNKPEEEPVSKEEMGIYFDE